MFLSLLGALFVGIFLGLLGSGGSILTVPVLVHLAGQGDKVAIAGSLAIVGSVAAAGSLTYARRGMVDWPSVLFFGIPGMVGTSVGARLAAYVSGSTQIALFACVAMVAAVFMLRQPAYKVASREEGGGRSAPRRGLVAVEGFGVGVLTGLVGVGGGFLIVPALVFLGGLGMTAAIGTSLVIIALKSATGFYTYVGVLDGLGLELDWSLLGMFTLAGIVGTLCAGVLAPRIPQARLRRVFGWVLVLVSVGLLYGEFAP